MNEFDQRWQRGAERARKSAPDEVAEAAPFGFAQRVVAKWHAGPAREVSLERVWERFGWRTLAGATVVLLLCLSLEGFGSEESSPLQPGVEGAVAEVFWLL